MRRLLTVAALLVFVVSSVTVQAGQKGNGKIKNALREANMLSYVMVSDDGNGVPNWGERISFQVNTTQSWNQVSLVCYQNGDVVYGAVWPVTSILTLSSQVWQGGTASCSAVVLAFDGADSKAIGAMNFTVLQ